MLKPLTAAYRRIGLADLGAVRVQGVDAVKFLQGQVSNDVTKLSPALSQLAGLHNAQGRVIALLRLVLVGPDEVLAILPRELAGVVAQRLSKFVLRAKAKVSDASPEWVIDGVEAHSLADGLGEARIGSARREEGSGHGLWICIDDAPVRWLVVTPMSEVANTPTSLQGDGDREAWRALDIAAGLPQVYLATSEAFVAQMLNLDVLDGIAFDKGCYTGQEIIARAHYRGRVKRRMQRFRTVGSARLVIGDSGQLSDGRSYRVVDAVTLADGRSEFLAVTATAAGDEAPGTPSPGNASTSVLDAEQLALPYTLPA